MLYEDVQLVLNLKQRRFSRSCEHFDHVPKLWVEKLDGGCCNLVRWHLELNSSLVSDLFCAPSKLLGLKVIVLDKQGFVDAQFAGKARDYSLYLYLVRLYSFFAGCIVHVYVHLYFFTGSVSMLFQ